MNKSLKIVILLTMVIIAAILIFPNIIQREYATIAEEEDKIEASKESISQDKEENLEVDEEINPQDEENVDKLEEPIKKYTLDNLNMRTGPSTDFERILTIPIGEEIMVMGQENGWDKITYNDKTGFASANYLTDSKEEADKAVSKNKVKDKKDSNNNQEAIETLKVVKDILIVNKTYGLPANYNPGEDSEAVAQLNKMIKGAKEEIGKKIMSVSGFRSYDYQKGLYNRYVKRDGEKKASMYSAKPGHSEHQTGLAFDIGGVDKKHWATDSFADTEEAKWLKDNAHRYGFILRYPKGKTDITGYKYEPWHFRYIGVEHATKVYENNLTLEEYLL
jgi:D-alanyl-D-alanine carboxypeptidase